MRTKKSADQNKNQFYCRDTGKECDWRLAADSKEEILEKALLLGPSKFLTAYVNLMYAPLEATRNGGVLASLR
jgi:hypothetical protein